MRTQQLTQHCLMMIHHMSAEAKIITVPEVSVPEERAVYYSFDRLKFPDSPVDCGPIADPAKFAAPVLGEGHEFHADLIIKAPGTDFYIPDLLAQFEAVVRQATDEHYRADRAAFQEYCALHISQGVLLPSTTFRVPGKHIDAQYQGVLREAYANNDAYTVSSALPTLFYDQPFEIDADRVRQGGLSALYNNVSGALNHQARPENVRNFGANHLVRHDSFMVHSAQIPQQETWRTFLQVRFFPARRDGPESINNRWLAEACARLSPQAL